MRPGARRGARGAPAPATSRSGAVVLDPDGAVIGAGHNAREADAGPDRARRDRGAAAGGRRGSAAGGWTAARWSSRWSRARCAPARSCWPGSHRLVFGAVDPKAGAVGSLWDVVRDRRLNHRPRCVGGVLGRGVRGAAAAFFAGSDRDVR